MRRFYLRLLTLCMDHAPVFLVAFFAFMVASVAVLSPWLGEDLFPSVDSGQFKIHVRAHTGMCIEDTAALCDHIDSTIRSVIPRDQLVTIIDNIGLPYSSLNLSYSTSAPVGPSDADIQVQLAANHRPTKEYVEELRKVLAEKYPGVEFYALPVDIVTQILDFGLAAPIDIQILGPKLYQDRALAERMLNRIRYVPGVADARIQQPFNYPNWTVDVDRTRAEEVGLTQHDVAQSMLIALSGSFQTQPTFYLNPGNGVSYNVETQTPQYRLDSLAALRNLPITSPNAAAHATAQASAADMANVDLSLHAEMATDYFELRGLDAQKQLLTKTVADMTHQLDLTEQRLKGGVATEADVALARTQLESTRAQLVDVGVARAQFEHAIGTLGNYDLSTFSIPPSPLNLALPRVPIGVPSQLLERRPDIATAERLTDAANARIGIAVSAFYPTISLGGGAGFESAHPGTWIQGPSAIWSLGAQATELLFDAGQRHALTSAARHAYLAQAAAFRNTVFQAFNDVENQLSTLRILEQESGVEQRAVAAAESSFNISNQRYKGGVTSYLEVLTTEAALLQNQRTAIDIETRRFAASVGLVRAVGGGWDVTQLPKQEPSAFREFLISIARHGHPLVKLQISSLRL